MSIFSFHLLNDYSGSPKVLKQLLNGWVTNQQDVHLVTASGREGFLSGLGGVKYHHFWYKWTENPYLRLVFLVWSQWLMFWNMYRIIRKDDTIYINTVLPFGAAFLGKIKGCRVIYHVHETSIKPVILKKLLFGIAQWSASEIIYVSGFLAKQEPFSKVPNHILHNAIEHEFMEKASAFQKRTTTPGKVLMLCSLKEYKGIHEFRQLAIDCPEFEFRLVLNASASEAETWKNSAYTPSNLTVYDTRRDTHPFFQWADIVLNLSRPDGWVETFGLTIIEGMAYGLPAIVPPVGGIAELVENGVNGYQVDSRSRAELRDRLCAILNNPVIYANMRAEALAKIQQFGEQQFIRRSLDILLR